MIWEISLLHESLVMVGINGVYVVIIILLIVQTAFPLSAPDSDRGILSTTTRHDLDAIEV